MTDVSAAYADLARMIDHAVLRPDATLADVREGCELAAAYGAASCCVMPHAAREAADVLATTPTLVCCVAGFPHGSHATDAKVADARSAVAAGAAEIDFVVNVNRVVSGDWGFVEADVRAVVDACRSEGVATKAIFECCYLDDHQKRRLCDVCVSAGVGWVKTSTGFGLPPAGREAGATDPDLVLMRDRVPPSVQVKASGGIRTLERLRQVRALGCSRAGTSGTAGILDALRRELSLAPIDAAAGYAASY